jgi:transcriptional regulator with XRE-family HTH domain
MTKTKPFTELAARVKANPVRRARISTYKQAMEDALALAELRAERGFTQTELAETLGVTQANISRIEREEDLYLSTLRGYLAALGAELEVSAVFPEARVTLDSEVEVRHSGTANYQAQFAPNLITGDAPLPSLVEAHLRADRNLNSSTASLLARMFRAAYIEAIENSSDDTNKTSESKTQDIAKEDE